MKADQCPIFASKDVRLYKICTFFNSPLQQDFFTEFVNAVPNGESSHDRKLSVLSSVAFAIVNAIHLTRKWCIMLTKVSQSICKKTNYFYVIAIISAVPGKRQLFPQGFPHLTHGEQCYMVEMSVWASSLHC
jgi:hypothetical protein